jgi:Tol biopolymer transport system component
MKRREALAVRTEDPGAEVGLWAVSLDGKAARRLGMTAADGGASWSNNGQWIAYAHRQELFVADREGEEIRTLTAFSGRPGCLHWSADDRSIRLIVSTAADRKGRETLWDVDVATSRSRRVFAAPTFDENCGAWMPNGRDYVFSSGSENDKQIWLLRQNRSFLGGGTTTLLQLTNGPSRHILPQPSTDGRRIFVIGSAPPGLTRYDLETGAMTPYVGGINGFNVEYAADASSVIYITHPDLILWRARADGRDARAISPAGMQVDAAAASPDGQWIAFRGRSAGTHTKVYIMPAAGGAAESLVPDDIEQGTPSWSADSTKLAYGDVPERFGNPTGSEVIHIYDRTTRQFTTLPGSNLLWSSRWSPDGRYIAALTISGQALKLYDLTTKQWRSLGVEHVGAITWSRDSEYIYCDPEQSETWLRAVRVADGAVRRLVDMNGRQGGHGAGLSLDGAPLFRTVSLDIYALELRYK